MNKIVPFNKEIEFESIQQITSISLEHIITANEKNTIKGNFIVSGTYKITQTSINLDEFNFELPFEINIDKKYSTDDITVDINDFYYEIKNDKILSLNIELTIDNLEEKEVKMDNREISNINEEIEGKETNEDSKEIEDEKEKIETIFDDLDCNEKYVTYKVHIMNENDTIETIIKEYNVKRSTLEDYNNLLELKKGDKIIIPSND